MERARKLAAIMFTDIEGYTALMQKSEEEALRIRNHHREVFEKTTNAHKGTILQYYGDGTLSIFDSAVEAVRCGYELQKQYLTKPGIPVRIGIHTGDILFSDEDIIGDAVNIAARIESLGIAGCLLFSEKVFDEIKNQKGIKSELLGFYHFKNVSKEMAVYAMTNKGLKVPKGVSQKAKLASGDSESSPGSVSFWRRSFLKSKKQRQKWGVIVFLLLIGLVSAFSLSYELHEKRSQQKLKENLSRIESLAEDLSFAGMQSGEGINAWFAFLLAKKVQKDFPKESRLEELWTLFSRPVSIYSEPSGAKVFAKAYEDGDSAWFYFGITPLDSIRFPYGYSNLKLERSGNELVEDVIWNTYLRSDSFSYRLPPLGSQPEGMILVNFSLNDQTKPGQYDFYMDRFEVTNQEYQTFVDSGGYHREEFWNQPFIKQGKTLSWEEAMREFTDLTGQTGPATWVGGTFPEGQANHPVGGISWYEAMAYAKFAGRSLPTFRHWDYVVANELSSVILTKSNYQGSYSLPVGSIRSLNRFGIQDMAGNVREWVINASSKSGTRLVMGGGWTDAPHRIKSELILDSWDRSPVNGFRCVKYKEYSPEIGKLEEWVLQEQKVKYQEKPPISFEIFQIYQDQFSYDSIDLEAKEEFIDETQHWNQEKISYSAAYGNERIISYLFLPKRGKPPFQTVIYFPAWPAYNELALQLRQIDFIMKSGRAVMYPVYYAMHERRTSESKAWEHMYRVKERRILQIKDLKRAIDYLQTRGDIDIQKLAFMGVSLGGIVGPIALATENRLKAGIFALAGLNPYEELPEIDERFYLPYVKQPVLLLNGQNDHYFPYETSPLPFYDLLGTPKEHKDMKVYPGGHHVPKVALIRESLSFLDHYLGPVNLMKD